MENTTDLFDTWDQLPTDVITILLAYNEKADEGAEKYQLCRDMQAALAPHGYKFDWGLDGEPFNLQLITNQ